MLATEVGGKFNILDMNNSNPCYIIVHGPEDGEITSSVDNIHMYDISSDIEFDLPTLITSDLFPYNQWYPKGKFWRNNPLGHEALGRMVRYKVLALKFVYGFSMVIARLISL